MSRLGVAYSAPPVSDDQLRHLIEIIKDWQFQHGSLLKFINDRGFAHPVGATLFPSKFPRSCFDEAHELQPIFNKLYAAVSEDEEWLHEALKGVIGNESSMAKILWEIHTTVKKEGYVQDSTLGLFRSDYMLHANRTPNSPPEEPSIRQVEFNTYSVAGGAHGNRVSNLHRYGASPSR